MLGYIGPQSALEKQVKSCSEYYNKCWRLDSVQEDVEQKYIYVKFSYRYKNYEERLHCIKKTKEELTKVLLESEDTKWRGYTIKLGFLNVGDYFDVEVKAEDIQITSNMNISIETIASLFPQAKVLYLYPARYESIAEVQGFEELMEIRFSQGLKEEEKAYVWSLFPDCMIK